jgi:apolipoprotein D and lipocalin family protein
VENYTWDAENERVDVAFTYTKASGSAGEILQRASIVNGSNTEWSLAVKALIGYIPVGMAYLVCSCAEDYSWTIIGVPDRKYLWIMSRTVELPHTTYIEALREAQDMGFDIGEVVKVQHDATFEDVPAQSEPEPEPEPNTSPGKI